MPDFSKGSFYNPYKVSATKLWRFIFKSKRLYVTRQFVKNHSKMIYNKNMSISVTVFPQYVKSIQVISQLFWAITLLLLLLHSIGCSENLNVTSVRRGRKDIILTMAI